VNHERKKENKKVNKKERFSYIDAKRVVSAFSFSSLQPKFQSWEHQNESLLLGL